MIDIEKEFNKHSETKGYVLDKDFDLIFMSNGYLFAIQTKNGFNNILFCKYENISSLRRSLENFRLYLIRNNIQYIRIEGSAKRYHFIPKMFQNVSFVEETNDNRHILYGKLF